MSVSSGLSVAEPKYFFPAATATVLSLAVAVEAGALVVVLPPDAVDVDDDD